MAPSRNRCELSAKQAKPAVGQMGTRTPPRVGKHVGESQTAVEGIVEECRRQTNSDAPSPEKHRQPQSELLTPESHHKNLLVSRNDTKDSLQAHFQEHKSVFVTLSRVKNLD